MHEVSGVLNPALLWFIIFGIGYVIGAFNYAKKLQSFKLVGFIKKGHEPGEKLGGVSLNCNSYYCIPVYKKEDKSYGHRQCM